MSAPSPLHLIFVSWEYPPETNGGIGAYVANIAPALAARGHKVQVISGVSTIDQAGVSAREGVMLHRLPWTDRTKFARPAAEAAVILHRNSPVDLVEAPELYAEGKFIPDSIPESAFIVRCHTPLFLSSRIDSLAESRLARFVATLRPAVGAVRHMRSPIPILCAGLRTTRLDAPYSQTEDHEYRTAARTDAILSPSMDLTNILGSTWPDLRNLIHTIPYPYTPPPVFQKMLAVPGNREVMYLGRLRFSKGVDTIARAVPAVLRQHPGIRFVFAGGDNPSLIPRSAAKSFFSGEASRYGSTLEWLQSRLAPFSNSVEFTGYLEPDALRARLAATDIVVLPSRWDNFPNTCLDAMCAGRAIIASDAGGMRDMLSAPAAGLLISPGSPHILTNALNRLLNDAALRHKLGQSARESVLSRYSAAIIGEAHEKLLQRICTAHAARGHE